MGIFDFFHKKEETNISDETPIRPDPKPKNYEEAAQKFLSGWDMVSFFPKKKKDILAAAELAQAMVRWRYERENTPKDSDVPLEKARARRRFAEAEKDIRSKYGLEGDIGEHSLALALSLMPTKIQENTEKLLEVFKMQKQRESEQRAKGWEETKIDPPQFNSYIYSQLLVNYWLDEAYTLDQAVAYDPGHPIDQDRFCRKTEKWKDINGRGEDVRRNAVRGFKKALEEGKDGKDVLRRFHKEATPGLDRRTAVKSLKEGR